MRERDVRAAVQAALIATNAFAGVWLSGLPENQGAGASELMAAAIEPVETQVDTGWDAGPEGALDLAAVLHVTLLARHGDPLLRDELAEQALGFLLNSVNGRSLAGLTLPQKTLVASWRWLPPTPPERRILASVRYTYVLNNWDGFDVS